MDWSRRSNIEVKENTSQEEAVFDKDIQFAVFDGGKEITPQMYEEVKNFTAYVKTINK